MEFFVDPQSVVRKIWGKGDTILFIFAGASAEFALNKAVDWLYFTGRLPADPLGRLFSTVRYARDIVFAKSDIALATIDKIAGIHAGVEKSRGAKIPDWAYRDVLFMLIHYSQASFELLERKMTEAEKQDLFDVFDRVGRRMGLVQLPRDYPEWLAARAEHLQNDLSRSDLTDDLFRQYRKHLGLLRYFLLRETQKTVAPLHVLQLLQMRRFSTMRIILPAYKLSRFLKMDGLLKSLILPEKYRKQVWELDIVPAN